MRGYNRLCPLATLRRSTATSNDAASGPAAGRDRCRIPRAARTLRPRPASAARCPGRRRRERDQVTREQLRNRCLALVVLDHAARAHLRLVWVLAELAS